VKCSSPAGRSAQAGFVLVEAVVAVALIALSAGAALAAVAAVTHASAHAAAEPALTLTAQNVLTDLRAATAYDPAGLAALAGRSAAFDADEPVGDDAPRRVHVVAGVAGTAADGYTATVTVSRPDGASVTVSSPLVQEAPAPGSVVPAATPGPVCDGASTGCTRAPSRIAL
jgi:type II secretory pathway pseudopilin PulG